MSKAEYQALLARGINAATANDMARARTLLRAASERDPDGIDAWLWLAQTAETPADALSCLRRALKISPDHARARLALQQLLLREGIAAAKAAVKDRARALLRELCALAPRDERGWLWRASVAERYEEAVECLTRVLDIHPGHAQAQAALDRMRQRAAARGAQPAPANTGGPPLAASPVHPDVHSALDAVTGRMPGAVQRPLSGAQPAGVTIQPAAVLPPRSSNPSEVHLDVTADEQRGGTPPAWKRGVDPPAATDRAHPVEDAAGHPAGAVPSASTPDRPRDVTAAPLSLPPKASPTTVATSDQMTRLIAGGQTTDVPSKAHGDHIQRTEIADAASGREPEGDAAPERTPPPLALPRTSAPALQLSDGKEPASTEPAPGTVLVVDDSPTVLKVVGFALKKHGLDVVTAASGPEALELLTSMVPDLVLLDINLPGMDGYQVCRAIRRGERTSRIPVVMLSGKDGFFDRIRGRMAGAVEYITKPFEPAELMAMLGKYFPVRLATSERTEAVPEPSPWSGRVLGRNA